MMEPQCIPDTFRQHIPACLRVMILSLCAIPVFLLYDNDIGENVPAKNCGNIEIFTIFAVHLSEMFQKCTVSSLIGRKNGYGL